MNAAGTHNDLTTMLHESGHAIHSFVTNDLEYHFFKDVPSEIAELASMAMELIATRYYDTCYSNPEDIQRAQQFQIERTLFLLPWIACVDSFQDWLYRNPGHTHQEREEAWVHLQNRFGFPSESVDYSGLEHIHAIQWQRQLHIFRLPFYYIEYAIAQLGAFQVWRNYENNPDEAFQQYLNGLRLGYTRSIGEVYETAGVEFNLSKEKLQEIAEFGKAKYDKVLKAQI
jgi:oligoendopeptidase F